MMVTKPVFSVVMAGGQGTRLWPLSREAQPKQFLSLTDDRRSLLQVTVDRAEAVAGSLERVLVVAQADQSTLVKEQLPELPEKNLLLESIGRNTAACIGLAAASIERMSPAAVMAVFPSDHLYEDEDAWTGAVNAAIAYADQADSLVAIGLPPSYPFTGYGYMKTGRRLTSSEGPEILEVLEFVEKPPLEQAQQYLESGKYLWNIGTFAWKVSVFQQALERHLPATFTALSEIGHDLTNPDSLAQVYEQLQDISVDYAVLEKESRVAVVRGSFRRIDVGTLASLDELLPVDEYGNASRGEVLLRNSQGNIIYSDEGLVGLIGMQDTIVIRKGEILLVCPKDRAAEVKELVKRLDEEGLRQYL
jgi:mannose-1-phosphate guanylyltransferase